MRNRTEIQKKGNEVMKQGISSNFKGIHRENPIAITVGGREGKNGIELDLEIRGS